MTLASENIIAIVAAVVSFGSMCAAIASAATARRNARIAEQAREQALKAATLERRAKAIDHLRKALVDIEDTMLSRARRSTTSAKRCVSPSLFSTAKF
jgi:hypothetical protein